MECSRLPNELIFVGIGFKLTTVQENSIETDSKPWTMLIKIGVMQFSNKEINLDIVELLGRSSPIK